MKEVFAHRAILCSDENSLNGIKNCVKEEVGIEIDLRGNDKSIYLNHDPLQVDDSFFEACNILRKSRNKIAIHIKEIEILDTVQQIIEKFNLKEKCFLFSDSEKFQRVLMEKSKIPVAQYINRKPKVINSKILWCDEVKEKWYDKELFSYLQNENNIIYTMSRELIEKCNMIQVKNEWERLLKLKVDGICTNYPLELKKFIRIFDVK